MTSRLKLNAPLIQNTLEAITSSLTESGEEVLKIASGTICYPTVDAEGNEKWVKIVVSVPQGDRSGEEFDGYTESEAYLENEQKKAEKAEEARKKKEEKIAKDKALREKKRAEKEKAKTE